MLFLVSVHYSLDQTMSNLLVVLASPLLKILPNFGDFPPLQTLI
jgi:hypothetical protein